MTGVSYYFDIRIPEPLFLRMFHTDYYAKKISQIKRTASIDIRVACCCVFVLEGVEESTLKKLMYLGLENKNRVAIYCLSNDR
nr:hypothetical protein [Tanacetum cinerariifolium]